MTREQAKVQAKGMIEQYLMMKGIKTRGNFRCINPRHNDKKGDDMALDRKNQQVHCFSCGAKYDIFDLVGMEYNLTDARAIFDKTYEVLGMQIDGVVYTPAMQKYAQTIQKLTAQIPPQPQEAEQEQTDYADYFIEMNSHLQETDYHRGISLETLNRFKVGYDAKWRSPAAIRKGSNPPASPRLIVPTSDTSYIARLAREPENEFEENFKKQKEGKVHIFNEATLQSASQPIYAVEGEIDSLSIIDVGGEAVGLGSTSSVGMFLKILEKKKPAQTLMIALDNDGKAGTEAADKLEAGLKSLGISSYRVDVSELYGEEAKDANEALIKDREGLKKRIEELNREVVEAQQEDYLKESQVSRFIQSFMNGIYKSVNTPSFPTGFKKLDNVLDGGLYEGLYVLGAVSSLGKTTFALQMCDQIAQMGNDVIIFCLEMARSEMMAKSISRETLLLAQDWQIDTRNAKSNRGITDGKRYEGYSDKEQRLINTAITNYSRYADRIFIFEGIGDIGVNQIREKVEKHIRVRGRKPVVVVDYLQILAPLNDRMTDKQNADKNILELKKISRDCKIPVIAISSLNRESYKTTSSGTISLADLKESGGIEYSADAVMGLQFRNAGKKTGGYDDKAEKKKTPREVELVILKNRSGAVGDSIGFDYYPVFNYFKEV